MNKKEKIISIVYLGTLIFVVAGLIGMICLSSLNHNTQLDAFGAFLNYLLIILTVINFIIHVYSLVYLLIHHFKKDE